MRFIISAPDHTKASEALKCAINMIESDYEQCAYERGNGNRYYAHRTKTGVSCRYLEPAT